MTLKSAPRSTASAIAARSTGFDRAPESETCSASKSTAAKPPQLVAAAVPGETAAAALRPRRFGPRSGRAIDRESARLALIANCVEKRPALPAIVVGREREHAIAIRRELKGSRTDGTRRCLPICGARERDKIRIAREQGRQVGHGRVAGKHHLEADGTNRGPRAVFRTGEVERHDYGSRCERRAVMKMHAGAQGKLPAMIVVRRLPVGGQGRTHVAVGIQRGEPIEDEPPSQAVLGSLPRVARDLNAQRTAVMRPRPCPARKCTKTRRKLIAKRRNTVHLVFVCRIAYYRKNALAVGRGPSAVTVPSMASGALAGTASSAGNS